MDYLSSIFTERALQPKQRESLWKYYYDKLSKAVDVGWNDGFEIDDKPLVEKLKFSIAEFSAFKETSFRKSVEALLTTEDGKLRNKTDFMKEAMKVSDDYNVRWLETEYHQTIANANMAAKWKSFEENIDLYPNVKLVSVQDGRVRPEHKALDGTIRPYNDPFWKTHTPPLDWGCRCNIIQTDEEPTEIPGGFQTKIEFENNPAESGKVLKGDAYKKGLTKEEVEEALTFINPKYTPSKLSKYEDELDINVNKDVFDYLGKKTPLRFTNPKGYESSTGAYFSPDKNIVVIPLDERRKQSKWKAESVIYHEFGHAADWHHNLKKKNEVTSLMDRFRSELDFKKIDKRLDDLGFWAYEKQKWDLMEKVGAAHDTLMSLNPNYGRGHRPSYWETEGNKEAEFIAHAFENKFAGNEVFKKVMPELYEESIKMIDGFKPKSKNQK